MAGNFHRNPQGISQRCLRQPSGVVVEHDDNICHGKSPPFNGGLMAFNGGLMAFNGGLMAFNGGLMAFNGGLMAFNGGLMAFNGGFFWDFMVV